LNFNMPNKNAKQRKWKRQKANKWLAENGRTANQIKKKKQKQKNLLNKRGL